jgi:hypothetical protein
MYTFYSMNLQPGVRITTRQLAKCEWNSGLASKNTNLLASLEFFFLSLTLSICLANCFFDLESENTELLARLASVLKNLIFTPLLQ